MSNESMPKFDFSGSSLSQEELETEVSKTEAANQFFKQGLHQVTIEDAEYMGVATDKNWGKVILTYRGAGGQSISDMLLIPFSDVKYQTKSGKGQLFPFSRFKQFVLGLGFSEEDLQLSNLPSLMKKLFSDVGVLRGKGVGIRVGYQGVHPKFSRAEDGSRAVNLVKRDGEPFLKQDGTAHPTFDSVDAADAYCEENNINFHKFPSVTEYTVSDVANDFSSKVDENW